MSRVFQALNKASNEKKRDEPKAAESSEPNVFQKDSPAMSPDLLESKVSQNGKDHSFPLSLPIDSNGTKNWREKVEELFFGWNLRPYNSHPIVALEEASPASEQYKILREQLRRLRTEAGIRTVAITSPVKKDDKTTVAVNLAAAIALEYEEKVLLIDADLRAPSVHRYFNSEGTPGLTDYLSSNSYESVRNLVRDTHLSGLQILPAGKPSRFTSELLAKEKMRRLIEEIQIELPGHMVIIDSPPVLSTPDPFVLSRQVDGVIMVIRAGKTPKDYLARALSSFEANKVLGVVLNGADLGLGSKYYYYYSRNGRG